MTIRMHVSQKFSVEAQLEEEIKDISNRYIHVQLNSKLIRDAIVQATCPFYPNMYKEEYKALKGLGKRKDIVIKQADKGQAIVLMNTEVYEEKANTLLRDTRNYICLPKNPLWKTYQNVKDKLNELISQGHVPTKFSSKVRHRGLPKLPNFYILPKVDKKGCPGRPIVSGIGHCTEKASRFLCQILQPFVDGSPSFIDQKYSRQFYPVLNSTQQFLIEIEKLNAEIPSSKLDLKNFHLATTDIESLYTNIPIDEGAAKVTNFVFENKSTTGIPLTRQGLLQLLKLVLGNNVFHFAGKFYSQKFGTAMGTPCAPPYANLFVLLNELKFFDKCEHLPYRFFRYLDDVFIVWYGDRKMLENFLGSLNSINENLK